MANKPIVLIGPYLSGKTTIRHLPAESLQHPHIGLVPWHDGQIVFDLFRSAGWTEEALHAHMAAGGDGYAYMRTYEIAAIEQAVQETSIQILKERPRSTIKGQDANKYLIEHPAYRELATITIYTDNQTPEETCQRLIAKLKPAS